MFSLMFAQTGFFLVKNREWGGRGMGAGGWGRGDEGEGRILTDITFFFDIYEFGLIMLRQNINKAKDA